MSVSLLDPVLPTVAFRAVRKCGNRASLLGQIISMLLLSLSTFSSAAPGTQAVPVAAPAGPGLFVTISHLGESEQQTVLRTGQLLAHRRAADPFGNIIRGPYKVLPPVVEHPVVAAAGPSAAAAAPVHVPTIEQAVQELSIGAVNVGAHEMLIGSRSIREGDLLVLESEGRQFVVWVQDIGVRGVTFCDIDMQKHILKQFGSGPKNLPADSVQGISSILNLLPKDAPP